MRFGTTWLWITALPLLGCLVKSTLAEPDAQVPINDEASALPDGNIDHPDGAITEPTGGWTDGHTIDIGANHTCALSSNGAILCWGSNFNGQTGSNPNTGLCPMPAGSIPCIETPRFVAAPPDSRWVRVSAGHTHSCAITDDDHLYCWGSNRVGQLGNGTRDPLHDGWSPMVEAPLTKITDVAAGEEHTCAIAGGRMYCWGRNDDGELGPAASPDDCGDDSCALSPSLVDEHTDWTTVVAAGQITCGLRGGAIYCWGWSARNQRDRECQAQCSAPVIDQIGTDTDWASISTWASRTCAIKSDGTLWCWGSDAGHYNVRALPVQIDVDNKRFAQVASGENHACAVTNDGALYCWGLNDCGQLGTGDRPLESCPDAPCAITPTRVGTGYAQVSVGYEHTCAIKTNGAALCWGINTQGELGVPSHEVCSNGACATRPIVVADPL